MKQQRCFHCMTQKKGEVCPNCGKTTVTNATHQLAAGTLLQNRYLVGKVLGQGGFGITYLGWDRYLETKVAIKEYYPTGIVTRNNAFGSDLTNVDEGVRDLFRENRSRFFREARTLAKFAEEPHIVHVHNLFLDNNTAYIVMEYVEGITLKQYVASRGGKLGIQETFDLLLPVMKALGKVHEAGLVHRDISPDNIMLQRGGGAKLLDFGAAREVEKPDVESRPTKSTEAILKHGYAPIEQYQRRGSLGPWTDVYALCATIYYCLTGSVPPEAPLRVMGEGDVDWDKIVGLTDSQRDALEKGMHITPKSRIRSVDELYSAWIPTEPTSETETEPMVGTILLRRPEEPMITEPVFQPEKELVTAPVTCPVETIYTEPVFQPEEAPVTAPVTRPAVMTEEPQDTTNVPYTAPVHHPAPTEEPADPPDPKKLPIALLAAVIALILTGVLLWFTVHIWTSATCTEASVCRICGKTGQGALGHSWTEATCTEHSKCSICGARGAEALGHSWTEATCTEHSKCSICGTRGADALGHSWIEASCTEDAKCSVCGSGGAKALGHEWVAPQCTVAGYCVRCNGPGAPATGHQWDEATCDKPKTCRICEETEGNALGHAYSGATCVTNGICSRCNEQGSLGGHSFPEGATCVKHGYCAFCGKKGGRHSWTRKPVPVSPMDYITVICEYCEAESTFRRTYYICES